MLNKAKHKTRLTQNMKSKHTSNAKTKTRRGEREKVNKSLETFFFPHLRRTFPLREPLILRRGGRIETVQAQKEHDVFKKISQRSKR